MTDTADQAFTSFLRRRSLAGDKALATLSDFGVTSLYDLKTVTEDPAVLEELKGKFEGNRLALKALGELHGAAIDNAIFYSENPEAEANAQTLGTFLSKNGVLTDRKGLDTLLSLLRSGGVTSLGDLKSIKDKRSSEATLKALTAKIGEWDQEAGSSFAAITPGMIAVALRGGPAEANEELKAFIRKKGLPAGIEQEFADCGITTLEQLKAVKEDKAPGGALDQLKARLDNSGMSSATRQVDGIRVADIQQEIAAANAPEAKEAAQRKAELAKAIDEAEKLRTKVEAKTKTEFDATKSEVEEQYKAVLGRIKDVSGTDVEAAMKGGTASQEALGTLLQSAIGSASDAQKVLDSVDTNPRPWTQLIQELELLSGVLITAGGAAPRNSDLVKLPEDLERMVRAPGKQNSFTKKYKGSEATALAVATAKQSCRSLAVSAEGSIGGFVGSGIAAVSAAASYADSRKDSEDDQKFENASTAECGEIRYIYVPKQAMQFDQDGIELSDAATKDLEALVELPADKQRQGVLRFYQKFGSHFSLRYYLGGRYEFTVTGKSSSKASKGVLVKAVAEATNKAVSASASYAGVGLAASAAASAKSQQSAASAEGTRFGDSSTDEDVTIQTDLVGGAALALENVSRDTWAQTLKHNSTWAVIDRANPLAVWELVPFDKNLTDGAKGLAPLLEEVWVRRVFLDSLEGRHPVLYRYLKENPTISTCSGLDDAVREVSADPHDAVREVSVDPQFTVVVETATSGLAAHPKAWAGSTRKGFKLIGGGAIVDFGGGPGSFLTGSYPEEGAWVASAKDHLHSSPATVTAYAMYLSDPDDEWDVKVVSAETEGRSGRPEITANLPAGYALTGGGASVDWGGPGMMLTANRPVTNADGSYGWTANAKAHLEGDSGKATAWVFGVKPKNGNKVTPSEIYRKRSQGSRPTLEYAPATSTGEVIVGGGSEVTYKGAGGMLTCSGLSSGTSADQLWKAEAKDHYEYDGSLELTMWVVCRNGRLADA